MDKYQIIQRDVSSDTGTRRNILWESNQVPLVTEIESIKDSVIAQSLERNDLRQPFRQELNDYILIRKQRTPRFLGWSTIKSINLYEEH